MRNSDRRALALETLLSASLATLESVGYSRLRTADVAKRSGMSEGTLFRYFPTKYDLTRASLEQALAEHSKRLVENFVSIDGPLDRRSLVTMLWTLLSHPKLAWTYELFAAAYTDTQLRRVIAPVLEAHTIEVDKVGLVVMSEFGGIKNDDARLAINLTTWAMQGLVLRDMARGDTGSQHELLEYLLFLAEAAYPESP